MAPNTNAGSEPSSDPRSELTSAQNSNPDNTAAAAAAAATTTTATPTTIRAAVAQQSPMDPQPLAQPTAPSIQPSVATAFPYYAQQQSPYAALNPYAAAAGAPYGGAYGSPYSQYPGSSYGSSYGAPYGAPYSAYQTTGYMYPGYSRQAAAALPYATTATFAADPQQSQQQQQDALQQQQLQQQQPHEQQQQQQAGAVPSAREAGAFVLNGMQEAMSRFARVSAMLEDVLRHVHMLFDAVFGLGYSVGALRQEAGLWLALKTGPVGVAVRVVRRVATVWRLLCLFFMSPLAGRFSPVALVLRILGLVPDDNALELSLADVFNRAAGAVTGGGDASAGGSDGGQAVLAGNDTASAPDPSNM